MTTPRVKIVVPYTHVHPLVERKLYDYGFDPEFVPMIDEFSYWRLLRQIWREREPVVIVEHDVLPWPGAIEEMCACPAHWCSFTYEINGGYGIHHAFGCTKITAALMEATPKVWDEVADREWHALDAQLCYAALKAGQIPHPHRPAVIHLKDAKTEPGTTA